MNHPITDEERERGLVKVFLRPEQVEALDDMMRARNYAFEFGPPMRFEEGGETERLLVLTDAGVDQVRRLESDLNL